MKTTTYKKNAERLMSGLASLSLPLQGCGLPSGLLRGHASGGVCGTLER